MPHTVRAVRPRHVPVRRNLSVRRYSAFGKFILIRVWAIRVTSCFFQVLAKAFHAAAAYFALVSIYRNTQAIRSEWSHVLKPMPSQATWKAGGEAEIVYPRGVSGTQTPPELQLEVPEHTRF